MLDSLPQNLSPVARRADSRRAVTASVQGGFVVFLIGMRINAWWRPDLWIPVIFSMGRMLRELRQHPELGLLGMAQTGFSNPVVLVQYWRSAELLMAFASGRNLPQLPAWTDYNRRLRATHAVGVWHETYVIEPGNHESIYVNMKPFGLGAAFGVRPATGPFATARGRMAASDIDGSE
jgi:hypothetical protein